MGITATVKRRIRPTSGPKVRTTAGPVAGMRVGAIDRYLGIPYAAPPVGERRWQAPERPTPWTEVRPAVKPGPSAFQRALRMEDFIQKMVDGIGLGRIKSKVLLTAVTKLSPAQSEDCLTLNIRVPAHARDLPVMVWIHGGDHTDGSGSDSFYDSDALPERRCVLVTINYRLGLFGWFTHPDLAAESQLGTAGNYGMLDQIAALEWVRDNIENFGGDPDNVTIFGESAGGDAVLNLMTAPAARGLFHRAIAQSPSCSGKWLHLERPILGLDAAQDASMSFADRVVGAGPGQLARLRAMDAEELNDAYRTHEDLARHFYPVVDGSLLPETAVECFANLRQAPVPLMIGYNADEGTLLSPFLGPVGPEFAPPADGVVRPDEVRRQLTESYGDLADDLLGTYPGLDRGDVGAMDAFLRDHMFGVHVDHMSRQHAAAGHDAFRYHYRAVPPSPKQTAGAFHAAEVTMVFDSSLPLFPIADDEHLLRREMGDRWYAFAATGSPAFPGRAEWPAYGPADPTHMVFDRPVSAPQPCPPERGLDLMRQRIDYMIGLASKLGTG